MTKIYTPEEVHQIVLGYVLEAGESLWERVAYLFEGNEEKYLKFLVENKHITKEQQENWLKFRYSDEEYENIEAMTYMSKEHFPDDLMDEYGVVSENYDLDYLKAKSLGLINVPVFIEYEDVSDFNEVYWDKVLKIIGHYLSSDLETYGEELQEMDELLNYYRGN